MRLLDVQTFQLIEYFEPEIPPYAILSHRWEAEEVLHADILNPNLNWQRKAGARKILLTRDQAVEDNLQYIWVDTCCIDKSSSAELSEAINSMFRWYAEAEVCYAFLSDVLIGPGELQPCSDGQITLSEVLQKRFAKSAWFTRGWTLQELIAPGNFLFFDIHWGCLGTRLSLAREIAKISGVERDLLDWYTEWNKEISPTWASRRLKSEFLDEVVLPRYSTAQKMSWAARRRTTRLEDQAYSLLGIFGINMPMMYGEGKRAFARLQEKLLETGDLSILAWEGFDRWRAKTSKLFAESPMDFVGCGDIVRTEMSATNYRMTNMGLRIERPLMTGLDDSTGIRFMILHLGCKRQAALTRTIALRLHMMNSRDKVFYVPISGPRTVYVDITWNQSSKWPSATVVRQFIEDDPYKPIIDYHMYILVKLSPSKADSWHVVKAYPESCWNASESCIGLSLTEKECFYRPGLSSIRRSGNLLLSNSLGETFVVRFRQQLDADEYRRSEELSFRTSKFDGCFPIPFDDTENASISNTQPRHSAHLKSLCRSGVLIAELEIADVHGKYGAHGKSIRRNMNRWPVELFDEPQTHDFTKNPDSDQELDSSHACQDDSDTT